jgi:hypothetical protein
LSQRFGRVLPLQSIFERPTVADFARELGDLRTATSALVTFDTKALRAEDDRPRLVMMPGIFSLPFYLRELAEAAAEELAIVSVQLPGLGDGERRSTQWRNKRPMRWSGCGSTSRKDPI